MGAPAKRVPPPRLVRREVAMPDHLFLIDLRDCLGARLPEITAKTVRGWFKQPGSLWVDSAALELTLAAWPEERDRPDEALIMFLRRFGRAAAPIQVNYARREHQGGRRYLYHREGSAGFELRRESPPENSLHLQRVPRSLRAAALRASPGHCLVLGDLSCAFMTFLGHVADDPVLRADVLEGDVHQKVADAIGTSREVGKILNNRLVGLSGPTGLAEELEAAGLAGQDARALHREWWARYNRAAHFRDEMRRGCGRAVETGRGVRLDAPDGRTFRFSPAEVAGTRLHNGRTKGFLTVFSSIWRAIEASVIDEATSRVLDQGGCAGIRLVLSMYDGLVFECTEGAASAAESLVQRSMIEAAASSGIAVQAKTWTSPYWTKR